jgi:hypothetical protein
MPDSESSEPSPNMPNPDDSGVQDVDRFFRFLEERTRTLEASGHSHMDARSIAMLEERISRWSPEWGDDLLVILYGDFGPPEKPLLFSDLGITVEAEKVHTSLVKSAMCVLKARVTVKEKSVSGVVDAARRIDTLLGIWAVIGWGNSGSGWWSHNGRVE